jgi:DNA polymerase III epsilon subunit-like protein
MDYVVIDFETGGLDNQVHALLSVGVLVLDHDLRELFRYYTLIKDDPIKLVDQAALDVNGITLEEIKTGLPIEQVINNLRFLIGEQVVVAHNAAFDVGFLMPWIQCSCPGRYGPSKRPS